jgi:hypothetical protein
MRGLVARWKTEKRPPPQDTLAALVATTAEQAYQRARDIVETAVRSGDWAHIMFAMDATWIDPPTAIGVAISRNNQPLAYFVAISTQDLRSATQYASYIRDTHTGPGWRAWTALTKGVAVPRDMPDFARGMDEHATPTRWRPIPTPWLARHTLTTVSVLDAMLYRMQQGPTLFSIGRSDVSRDIKFAWQRQDMQAILATFKHYGFSALDVAANRENWLYSLVQEHAPRPIPTPEDATYLERVYGLFVWLNHTASIARGRKAIHVLQYLCNSIETSPTFYLVSAVARLLGITLQRLETHYGSAVQRDLYVLNTLADTTAPHFRYATWMGYQGMTRHTDDDFGQLEAALSRFCATCTTPVASAVLYGLGIHTQTTTEQFRRLLHSANRHVHGILTDMTSHARAQPHFRAAQTLLAYPYLVDNYALQTDTPEIENLQRVLWTAVEIHDLIAIEIIMHDKHLSVDDLAVNKFNWLCAASGYATRLPQLLHWMEARAFLKKSMLQDTDHRRLWTDLVHSQPDMLADVLMAIKPPRGTAYPITAEQFAEILTVHPDARRAILFLTKWDELGVSEEIRQAVYAMYTESGQDSMPSHLVPAAATLHHTPHPDDTLVYYAMMWTLCFNLDPPPSSGDRAGPKTKHFIRSLR